MLCVSIFLVNLCKLVFIKFVDDALHRRGWWLPGGHVELNETFEQAAVRETFEEAGIHIRLIGVLRVEHGFLDTAVRMRVIFLAESVDDTPPKARRRAAHRSQPPLLPIKIDQYKIDQLKLTN